LPPSGRCRVSTVEQLAQIPEEIWLKKPAIAHTIAA
jgi:hypothetical protein